MRCSTRSARSCPDACGAPFLAMSTVDHHTDPDAFLAAAEPLLARNPAVRAFVSSWVATWRDDPRARPTIAATYGRDGSHGLALLREGPLVIENSDATAAAAFAGDLADRGVPVMHVIGEAHGCAAFADAWQQRVPCVSATGMRMRHHMLTALEPVSMVSGTMRPAQELDLAWLTRNALGFARDARLPDRPDQIRASVRRRVRQGDMRLWIDGARVAFASAVRVGATAARVGLVYTLARYRGHGYATTLVAAIVREQLAAGARHVFLITDADNRTSNALYARIGFRPVSDQVRLDLLPPSEALR